ncbi:DivIVA domain-containing protein [Nocardia alni]|uniref:DivIVA domain-containing protein n=1 Tax=Nocardia alni TaxID=2815723 RepID=UPI001C21F69B|nr:DivIVA domain-containing protein [Nocardia alni]
MIPEELRQVCFARAPLGRHGYDASEVDAFRERIAQAFGGRSALSAVEIREHEFADASFGHRGYDRDEVDEFLDRACVELEFARRAVRRRPREIQLTPHDVQHLRFSAPPTGHAGYDADEVDVFLDRVAGALAHIGPGALRSQDVHTVNFGLAHTGTAAYFIDEVDAFLDVVAHTLAAGEASHT